jgi:hypothetical protein
VPLYEVTAYGFNGGTDATDERVLWIESPTKELVHGAIADTGAQFHGRIPFAEGTLVDYVLPRQADALRLRLLQFREHRLSNDQLAARRYRTLRATLHSATRRRPQATTYMPRLAVPLQDAEGYTAEALDEVLDRAYTEFGIGIGEP